MKIISEIQNNKSIPIKYSADGENVNPSFEISDLPPSAKSYKKRNYGGPNPPKGNGVHHYHFKFFALDNFLDLPEMSLLKTIEEKMQGHILDQEEIIGLYER